MHALVMDVVKALLGKGLPQIPGHSRAAQQSDWTFVSSFSDVPHRSNVLGGAFLIQSS